ILDARESEREATLKDVIDVVNSDFRKLEWILRNCTKSEEIWSLDTHARNVLNHINAKGHFPTVPESLKIALKDWNNPRLLANTSRTDWTTEELLNGSVSVFLIAAPDKMSTEGAVVRTLLEALLLGLLAKPPKEKPDSPLLFVLDDFLQLPPLNLLERALSADSGHGLHFWLTASSMTALRHRYGKSADTLIEMCKIKTFSNPKGQAARDLSKYLGYVQHPLMNDKKPLITVQELESSEFKAFHVVTIAGVPPAKIKKRFFNELATEAAV
ncbi:MAG: type IV secretory system conjugative DNA transfer family protein, partial [Methylobacter sp.]